MHRDLKLGMALAVLLIGATTAFFFRNDADPALGLPQLQNPERLDVEIAGREVIPYLGEPECDPVSAESPWAKPAFLGGATPTMRRTSVTPDPIRIIMEEESELIEPGPLLVGPTVPTPEPALRVDREENPNDETTLDHGSERVHVVQSGDTLTGLAARYLGSITRFGEIYDLNRDRLSGPNDLRVGMSLRIPPSNPADTPAEAASADPAVVGSPEATDAVGTVDAEPAAPDAGKRFVPAGKAPFVPGRYRAPGVPSAEAGRATDPKRE